MSTSLILCCYDNCILSDVPMAIKHENKDGIQYYTLLPLLLIPLDGSHVAMVIGCYQPYHIYNYSGYY